jgi:hypothetical protein
MLAGVCARVGNATTIVTLLLFLQECQRFSIAAGTMSQPDQLLKHFELARRDLLELSTANRMLSTPREQLQGASIEIVDESAAEVFRMLVREGSTKRFEEGVLDESASPAEKLHPDQDDASAS